MVVFMPLRVKAENVPIKKVVLSADQGQGSMVVRQAYGNESSLMVATRPPGYHTKPHMHVSEQINHVMEGEIWFFVEDQGYHCKKGDFHRIPANKVHWAWNRSQSDAVVVESHSPPLVGGEIIKGAAGLFDEGETPNSQAGENQFVPTIRSSGTQVFSVKADRSYSIVVQETSLHHEEHEVYNQKYPNPSWSSCSSW
jgi:quercetin dioxygenase-like cupin family protein